MNRSTHKDSGDGRRPDPLPLTDLLKALDRVSSSIGVDDSLLITDVCDNPEHVGPGALFVAIRGKNHNGHDSISAAQNRGAAATVVQRGELDEPELAALAIPAIEVDDTRAALSPLVTALYREPAAQMTMVGITGTNGKTTVSYLIEQSLRALGVQTGVLGTVEYRYYNRDQLRITCPAPLTTPDPVTLQKMLREMADSGVTHVIMEASSHALQQQRLGSMQFDLSIFTNLSQDHLDYHLSMDDYFAAKCLLFTKHTRPDGMVVVTEQPEAPITPNPSLQVAELCRSLALDTLVCGESDACDLKLVGPETSINGVTCRFVDQKGRGYRISSRLIGRFNITNLMTAFTGLISLGHDPDRCAGLVAEAAGAPGRIEPIRLAESPGGRPTVIVDYAHTPDALEKVLAALKEIEHRRLICVFGCGGDRDQEKRNQMGEIAGRMVDSVIVTDDNPRREDPAAIRAAIVQGVAASGLVQRSPDWIEQRKAGERGFVEIGDRTTAIHLAVTCSKTEDVVLIAGKGHENYQIIGTEKRFFDDTLCAQQSSLSWNLASVAEAAKGKVVCEKEVTTFGAVSTDTRTIGADDIFVALKGEMFDGHDFLPAALENGAGCLVLDNAEGLADRSVCCVQVDDTLEALGDLANYQLNRVRNIASPITIGLTGSCGKTTVKEMAAVIFKRRWPDRPDRPPGRVLKTEGNFNNLIGLPLSLLPVSVQHRVLVLEMGMNSPGEIARLAAIGDPDICCITNVHQAHLEGLGSIAGVAAAKGELFAQSRPDSIHVVNLDDEHVVELSLKFSNNTVGYGVTESGLSRNPEVWAEDIVADDNGHLSLVLHVGQAHRRLTLRVPGLHNSSNCCAAAAIAHAAGIDFMDIVEGLENFRGSSKRMERLTSPGGLKILNDSYNANPASMASGLRTLGGLPARNRMAVLGDMLELGNSSDDLHRSVGTVAAQSDLAFLALVGKFADQIRQGAMISGMDPGRIRVFDDKSLVIDWIEELVRESRLDGGDWLLVKASRGVALDTVIDQIMERC